MGTCAWCKKVVNELVKFVFISEDEGYAFVCDECLREDEGEFYKEVV